MRCTGLKKCIPQKRSGRLRPSASVSMEMVEVLLASTACAGSAASVSASTVALTLGFSTTASTATSTPAKSP